MTPFTEYLNHRLEAGGFTTEDALASFLPLMRQVAAAHRAGLVAPLEGIEALKVDGLRISYDDALCRPPALEIAKLRELEKAQSRAVEVVGELRVTVDINQ